MESIYQELQKIGFSKYESKAYVGLLKDSPVTGYELSKQSGVPRSMIYEVMGKLIDRGAAYPVPSEPIKYSPVPAKDLVKRYRHNYKQTLDNLETELNCIESTPDVDVIWHIRSDEKVITEMVGIICNAKEELWISVWQLQIPQIKKSVEEAINNGVKVFSVLFDAESEQLGYTFNHNYLSPEAVKDRIGGSLSVVARDGEEVLIANFLNQSMSWGVKTCDKALVLLATEYIRHDIMIEEIMKEFGADRLDALWRKNQKLLKVVTGKLLET